MTDLWIAACIGRDIKTQTVGQKLFHQRVGSCPINSKPRSVTLSWTMLSSFAASGKPPGISDIQLHPLLPEEEHAENTNNHPKARGFDPTNHAQTNTLASSTSKRTHKPLLKRNDTQSSQTRTRETSQYARDRLLSMHERDLSNQPRSRSCVPRTRRRHKQRLGKALQTG